MPLVPTLRRPHLLVAAFLVAGPLLLGGSPVGADPAQVPPVPSTSTPSSTTTVPPDAGCDEVVHDPDDLLQGSASLRPAALQLVVAGAALRLRVVDDLPDVEGVAALEAECSAWLVDGQRPDRAVWLFVDPEAGATSLWYGSGLRDRIGARFASWRAATTTEGMPVDGDAMASLLERIQEAVAAPAAPVDPFGCEQLLWDPTGQLEGTEAEDAAFALQGGGGDLHVRVEPPSDGDIDARIEQLDQVCPGWKVGEDRPERQLVVMVQPSARSTGVWYGRWWDDRLEGRWELIQEREMNPEFREGDYDAGLAAGLRSIGGGRGAGSPARPWRPGETDDLSGGGGSDGSSGAGSGAPVGLFVLVGLFFVAAWGISYLNWRSKVDSGETELSWGEFRGQGASGGRRYGGSRRSWGSSGGGSSRRSSGGGGRRSSGGGRRSGGGSTRW